MIRNMCAALTLVAITIFSSASAQPKYEKPSDIPVEAFAALPTFSSARLSPSGEKVGYFISYEGRKHLVVQKLDGSEQRIIPPWDDKLELLSFFWKTDTMIVFKVTATYRRWEFNAKIRESKALSFNLENPNFVWLGKPNPRRNEKTSQNESIIDILPHDPKHILLQTDFSLDTTSEVYKVNVYTGKRKKIRTGRKGINGWYTDTNSEIRLGSGFRPRSKKLNIIYKNADGKWIDIKKTDWSDKYDIMGITTDPKILYVSGLTKHGTQGLFLLDVTKEEIIEELFARQDVDITGAHQHFSTGKLVGVSFTDDYSRIKYFDKSLDKLQRSLARVLPDHVSSIVSKARDKELYLIYTENDTNPGDYYLYDRKKRNMDWIATVRNTINPDLMAPVKKLSIPMRDGSTIPAYLAIPKGHEPQNLPTVILPHGGPHARDTQEWDWWAQFYASRGYLVLKPNFRGSTGYGEAFYEQGKKQWGGLMQDDLTDATKWLIDEGMADPERICIIGASYGGYAALMGVIKEPGLYKCAASINGVTSISKIKSYDRDFIGGRKWIEDMGLAGAKDSSVSPHDRVDEVSAPILLLASKDDTRIPYRHSKDLHNKLKRKGKDNRYVEIPNGTHYMLTAESRLITLRETEKFLAKYIGKEQTGR